MFKKWPLQCDIISTALPCVMGNLNSWEALVALGVTIPALTNHHQYMRRLRNCGGKGQRDDKILSIFIGPPQGLAVKIRWPTWSALHCFSSHTYSVITFCLNTLGCLLCCSKWIGNCFLCIFDSWQVLKDFQKCYCLFSFFIWCSVIDQAKSLRNVKLSKQRKKERIGLGWTGSQSGPRRDGLSPITF